MSDLKNKVVAAIQGNPVSPNRPTLNQFYKWDGTEFALSDFPASLPPDGTASGDLSGSYPNPTVVKLQGTGISSTAPSIGQVLEFDGTNWTPSDFSDSDMNFTAGTDLAGTNTSQTVVQISGVLTGTTTAINILDQHTNSPYMQFTTVTPVSSLPGISFTGNQSAITFPSISGSTLYLSTDDTSSHIQISPDSVILQNSNAFGNIWLQTLGTNGNVIINTSGFLEFQSQQGTSPTSPSTPHHWLEIREDASGPNTRAWIPIYH